jgi:hypothetical protein
MLFMDALPVAEAALSVSVTRNNNLTDPHKLQGFGFLLAQHAICAIPEHASDP